MPTPPIAEVSPIVPANDLKSWLKLWKSPVTFLYCHLFPSIKNVSSPSRGLRPENQSLTSAEIDNLEWANVAKGLAFIGIAPLIYLVFMADQLSSAAFLVGGGAALAWLGLLLAAAAVIGAGSRLLVSIHTISNKELPFVVLGSLLSIGLVGWLNYLLVTSSVMASSGTMFTAFIVVMVTAALFLALSLAVDFVRYTVMSNDWYHDLQNNFNNTRKMINNSSRALGRDMSNALKWRAVARILAIVGVIAASTIYAIGIAQTGQFGLHGMVGHTFNQLGLGVALIGVTVILALALACRVYAEHHLTKVVKTQKDKLDNKKVVVNGYATYAKWVKLTGVLATGMMMYPAVQCLILYYSHQPMVVAQVFPVWLAVAFMVTTVGLGACMYMADSCLEDDIEYLERLPTAAASHLPYVNNNNSNGNLEAPGISRGNVNGPGGSTLVR